MAKRSATRTPVKGGNPRRPCPCGSGKRYKACHGTAGGAEDVIVPRPFDGLAAECDLVALREFVPSATAPLPLAASSAPDGRDVTLATVLPLAAAAMVRADGSILVGLQVQTRSGDLSRDLGRAVRWAQQASPGDVLPVVDASTAGGQEVRLQDLMIADASLDVTLHRLRLVDPRRRAGRRGGGAVPAAGQRRDHAHRAGERRGRARRVLGGRR